MAANTWLRVFQSVPRPVYAHGLVYIATGFNQPSLLAIRAEGTGNITGTQVAWTVRRGAPLTPSPIAVGDDLYIVNDGGIASCRRCEDGRGALAASARRQLFPHLYRIGVVYRGASVG